MKKKKKEKKLIVSRLQSDWWILMDGWKWNRGMLNHNIVRESFHSLSVRECCSVGYEFYFTLTPFFPLMHQYRYNCAYVTMVTKKSCTNIDSTSYVYIQMGLTAFYPCLSLRISFQICQNRLELVWGAAKRDSLFPDVVVIIGDGRSNFGVRCVHAMICLQT